MNEAKNTAFKNEANADAYKNNEDLIATTLPRLSVRDVIEFPDSLTETYEMTLEQALKMFPYSDLSHLGMTLNQYQKQAEKTKSFPEKYAIIYPALGLAEEAGEVAGKVKKWLRGDTEVLNIEATKKEMGDVLWYLASLATDLGITLEDIALTNIQKLQDRKKAGTIKGDGDNR